MAAAFVLCAGSVAAEPVLLVSPQGGASGIGAGGEASMGQDTGGDLGRSLQTPDHDIFQALGDRFDLQFLAEGDGPAVTAVTLRLGVPAGTEVNLDQCVSSVPSTHTAACSRKGDEIRIAIFSMSNAPLSTGSLGSIEFTSGPGELTVNDASFSDASGEAVSVDVL